MTLSAPGICTYVGLHENEKETCLDSPELFVSGHIPRIVIAFILVCRVYCHTAKLQNESEKVLIFIVGLVANKLVAFAWPFNDLPN